MVSSVAYPSALGVPCFLENDVRTAALGVQRYDAGAAILQSILRELESQRQASALARKILAADMLCLLPPDYEAGLWGAIALAERGLRH